MLDGNTLKRMREQKGWTQYQVAVMLGYTNGNYGCSIVGRMEKDEHTRTPDDLYEHYTDLFKNPPKNIPKDRKDYKDNPSKNPPKKQKINGEMLHSRQVHKYQSWKNQRYKYLSWKKLIMSELFLEGWRPPEDWYSAYKYELPAVGTNNYEVALLNFKNDWICRERCDGGLKEHYHAEDWKDFPTPEELAKDLDTGETWKDNKPYYKRVPYGGTVEAIAPYNYK